MDPAEIPMTPLPDASMTRFSILYPVGILPKETLIAEYYTTPMANGEAGEAPIVMRSRSHSNTTLDARDVRRRMKLSLTDLFTDFKIEDPTDPLNFDREFPLIIHLCEAFRVRGDGPIVRYKADWHRQFQQRIIRRPKPNLKLKLDGIQMTNSKMAEQATHVFSIFMPIASRVYLELFSALFGEGQSAIDCKTIASNALTDCLLLPDFKKKYAKLSTNPLVLHLTGYMRDSWKFDLGSITSHGLSCLLYREATTYALQTKGTWVIHCKNGSKIVLYRDRLLIRSEILEAILPPESSPPDVHAAQAHRLMAAICQVPKDELMWTTLVPKIPFFLGDAVASMLKGIIYSSDPELFALGVQHIFEDLKDDSKPLDGKQGYTWMPLNILAFAATFLLIELARVAGFEHMGGQDIRNVDSLYSFTSFEASIFEATVNALRRIYDRPKSPEGIALHARLRFLESHWKLNQYAAKHRQAYDTFNRGSDEYY
ncbi:hypothetical protein HYPSUDRAFT_201439 [Hypholoma sublateritium FD-334 SS-4]|uniref:Uncharacterized protein n=1 Tax=Hypholoma sublateritium (strain FD-334 SS-4) TaxID=945553 RepID=A0A0D2L888_HYPSF|nr:hypothetical protein HYPSUDRAFT_201439 [Hypholoma sublateritium FD-334 SS-4]